jgi:hypothetical protein
MSTWNIFLDFDRTIAEGHSGGHRFSDLSPMGKENKKVFLMNVASWLKRGYNVAVITRGIDTAIGPYFEDVLGLTPIMNDYKKGSVCIYAPDEETYNTHRATDFWALKKTEFVADILEKIGPSKSIFMDDTEENVEAMKAAFPTMICEVAEAGAYETTFATVNSFLPKSGGSRRKHAHRRQTRRNNKNNKNSRNKRNIF